jgi:hypothetical protein
MKGAQDSGHHTADRGDGVQRAGVQGWCFGSAIKVVPFTAISESDNQFMNSLLLTATIMILSLQYAAHE